MSGPEGVLRRFVSEVLGGDDRAAAADELLAESFEDHDPLSYESLDTIPELRFELLLVVADGSRVAGQWQMTGTGVNVTGVDMLRVEEGRVVERWSKWERHLLIEQLGTVT